MTNTKYKFIVTFKDDTKREYYATSYATLYEYFLLTPRLDYSIDDIESVDLIREYYYHSILRNARCKCEVTEDQYDLLAQDFQKHYDIMVANGVDTVDVYIQTYMSLNY